MPGAMRVLGFGWRALGSLGCDTCLGRSMKTLTATWAAHGPGKIPGFSGIVRSKTFPFNPIQACCNIYPQTLYSRDSYGFEVCPKP